MPRLLSVDELVPRALHDALTFLRKLIRNDGSLCKTDLEKAENLSVEQRLKASLSLLKLVDQTNNKTQEAADQVIQPELRKKLVDRFQALLNERNAPSPRAEEAEHENTETTA